MQTAAINMEALSIGARGSRLSLTQAEAVRRQLAAAYGLAAEAVTVTPVTTSGDRISGRRLADAGGKGLFTKEIDEALLDGRVDAAVHSAKDIPTQMPDGIAIVACLKRGDVRDAFVSPLVARLADLPAGARVGTTSPRRRALALRARPDVAVVDLTGNVETRLKKIDDGVAEAAILAAAGLTRLGLVERAASMMAADEWLPAAGQGIIAVAVRADDAPRRALFSAIDDRDASTALATERAFLAALDGTCRTPIGGLARVDGGEVAFRGIIVKPDGSVAHEVRRSGPTSEAERIGADAGAELRARGGADFFVAV